MPYGPLAKSVTADDYEFHCVAPDCTEHSHDSEDFLKCESCGRLACMAHTRYAEGDPLHRFCEECFKCSACGETAAVSCEECGKLLCTAHANRIQEPVDEWNSEEPHYYCYGLCRTAQRKPVTGQILEEKREVV
jgi:hypothetical protein